MNDLIAFFTSPTTISFIALALLLFFVGLLIHRGVKYAYTLIKKNPFLVLFDGDSEYTYFEYDHELNKYVKKDLSFYDKTDRRVYKIVY